MVPESMNDPDLTALSQKLDFLVATCLKLKEENRLLRAKEMSWQTERAQLMEKNDAARSKVEAMISRLRTLEHES
ncbi:TIGR02449 family protein [Endozoicomonas sp. OPT23]|uniref:TIGR02449 family protein n=1 Tax=Endozoicomonas sp. OPT23 TaxID=2072845 RepID=UPI00351B09EA